MSEPARHIQDEIEAAAASFQGPEPTLEQLMSGIEPIRSMDQLDIPDLTDAERDAFAAALDPSMTDTIAVDTNVFTAQLRKAGKLSELYARHVVGQRLAIAPQTVAEARFGAIRAGWGPRRVTEIEQIVRQARVLPVDRSTVEEVAQLRHRCLRAGHPLHQRAHNADLWIAAAAIRWGLTLVAHDAVFQGCPGLDLRTELS